MDLRSPRSRRSKPRAPAPGAAVLPRSKKTQPPKSADPDDLPSRKALMARLESQRLELLRAMACVHLARRTIEEHVAEPRHGDVLPLRREQHEMYRQHVLEALSAAGDALGNAYPMLERIARALDAAEMLKEHAAERSRPAPARRPLASRPA